MSRSRQPDEQHFIDRYVELEQVVQQLIACRCADFCELCTACCCRADICEEALESPFLQRVHRRLRLDSDRYGFLDTAGCTLPAGRPPVCYAFFCDELLAAQEDDFQRDLLRVLGHLVSLVGEKALGTAHLVELMDDDQLDQVDFAKLTARVDRALDAAEQIRAGMQTGRLDAAAREFLERLAGFALRE